MNEVVNQFDNLTVPVDDFPALNTESENKANEQKLVNQADYLSLLDRKAQRPVYRLTQWGSTVLAPNLGPMKEYLTEKEIKERIKKNRGKKLDDDGPKGKPVTILDLKGVVLTAQGPNHNVAYTQDSCVFMWENTPDESRKPSGKGGGKGPAKGAAPLSGKGKGPAKPAAPVAGGKPGIILPNSAKGDGSDEVEEKTVDKTLPRQILELQGFDIVSMWCTSTGTYIVTQGGDVYEYTEDEEGRPTVTVIVEGHGFVDCQVGLETPFFVALNKQGEVFTWGENTKTGVLGHPPAEKGKSTGKTPRGETENGPQQVMALAGKNIIQIAIGVGHMLALADSGEVFAWGEALQCCAHDKKPKGIPTIIEQLTVENLNNIKGEIEEEKTAAEPSNRSKTPFGDLEHVVRIASGPSHCLATTSKGRLFSWGKGADGGLGHGDTKDADVPHAIAGLTGVVSFAAGESHSLVVCNRMESDTESKRDTNVFYSWGKGQSGVLGHSNEENHLKPSPIVSFTEAQELNIPLAARAGYYTSFALLQRKEESEEAV